MKALTDSLAVIREALASSAALVVSPDGKSVRRRHPLPVSACCHRLRWPFPSLCGDVCSAVVAATATRARREPSRRCHAGVSVRDVQQVWQCAVGSRTRARPSAAEPVPRLHAHEGTDPLSVTLCHAGCVCDKPQTLLADSMGARPPRKDRCACANRHLRARAMCARTSRCMGVGACGWWQRYAVLEFSADNEAKAAVDELTDSTNWRSDPHAQNQFIN